MVRFITLSLEMALCQARIIDNISKKAKSVLGFKPGSFQQNALALPLVPPPLTLLSGKSYE